MEKFGEEKRRPLKLFWLIKLRWIAVAGVICTILFATKVLKMHLKVVPLYAVTFILAAYNIMFTFILRYFKIKRPVNPALVTNVIANTQISFDLAGLAVLIHFTGGIENPFIFYFVFHVIIAGIFLSRRDSFLQATFAVFLYSSVVFLEYYGIGPHYCLREFSGSDLHLNPLYVAGVSFAVISTLYIASYLAAFVSHRLRKSEKNLRQANKMLEEKDRLKSEYVLRVTHNVKGHLAAIQSCIKPVTQGITGSLNEKQMFLLQKTERRTDKLLFFVKALLGITRIKLDSEMKMEYFSIGEVVKNVLATLEEKAGDKNVEVEVHVDDTISEIWGVQEYIEEVVLDLMANAIKYTKPDGKVKLDIIDKDDIVLMKIEDNGIGIPKADLSKVFEEFYRSSNAKEFEKDGTGLGLSIVRQVIERHGGRVWAESEEGKGSIFNIILPKTKSINNGPSHE